MKHLFTLIISLSLLVEFSSCQRKGIGERYEYELMETTQVYSSAENGTRLADLPAGTRVTTYGPAPVGTYRPVDYEGYNVVLYQPNWYATKTMKGPRVTAYKPISSYTGYVGSSALSRSGSIPSNYGYTPSTGATIHTGPRGGRYYINSNGNKTYVKKGSSVSSSKSSYGSSRSRSSSYGSSSRSSGGSYRSSGSRGRK